MSRQSGLLVNMPLRRLSADIQHMRRQRRDLSRRRHSLYCAQTLSMALVQAAKLASRAPRNSNRSDVFRGLSNRVSDVARVPPHSARSAIRKKASVGPLGGM